MDRGRDRRSWGPSWEALQSDSAILGPDHHPLPKWNHIPSCLKPASHVSLLLPLPCKACSVHRDTGSPLQPPRHLAQESDHRWVMQTWKCHQRKEHRRQQREDNGSSGGNMVSYQARQHSASRTLYLPDFFWQQISDTFFWQTAEWDPTVSESPSTMCDPIVPTIREEIWGVWEKGKQTFLGCCFRLGHQLGSLR